MTEKTLQTLRSEIDLIDEQIVQLLAKRFSVTRQVGQLKAREGLPSVDADREAAQKLRHEELATASGIASGLVCGVFRLVIEEVVREHQKV